MQERILGSTDRLLYINSDQGLKSNFFLVGTLIHYYTKQGCALRFQSGTAKLCCPQGSLWST